MPSSPRAVLGACAAAACALLGAAPAGAAFSAAPDVTFGPQSMPHALAVADVNSDGRADLVVTDYWDRRVNIRLGNGDGTFGGTQAIENVTRPDDVVVGDFNADGNEDLAIAGDFSGHELAIMRGAGDGTFPNGFSTNLRTNADTFAIGDFTGDGRNDLTASTYEDLSVRIGVGDGTLTGGTDYTLGYAESVVTGDFDGDGLDDLATLFNGTSPKISVLHSYGDGSFGDTKVAALPADGDHVATGDLDGDGKKDLVVTVPEKRRVLVRLGNGDRSLRDAPDVILTTQPYAVVVADLDGDGTEDLAIANRHSGSVSIRPGNGDGTFGAGEEVAVGETPYELAAADFDRDGRMDLAVTAEQGHVVSIRLGAGPAPLAGNLLVNGGFEQGLAARLTTQAPAIPGWQTTGGMTFARYGLVPHLVFPSQLDGPRFAGGLNFLAGGDSTGLNGITSARQTVAVAGSAQAIDAGRATTRLSAWLGGGSIYGDSMRVYADFLAANGERLGGLSIGPVTNDDRANVTTLLHRAATARVPAGSRSIRVTITSTDVDTSSSASADNVRLALDVTPAGGTPPPPPPPPPPPGARFGSDTKVVLALAARRVGLRGPVRVRIANGNEFAVTGRLAARSFTVAAHGRRTIAIALTKKLRRQLARRGRVALRLRAVVQDPAGTRRTITRRVTPRLSPSARRGAARTPRR